MLIIDRAHSERVHDGTLAFFSEHGVAPRWRHHGLQDYAQLTTLVAGGQRASLVHEHVSAQTSPGIAVLELAEPGARVRAEARLAARRRHPLTRLLRRSLHLD